MQDADLLDSPLCPPHPAFWVAKGFDGAMMVEEVAPELDGVLAFILGFVGREVPVVVFRKANAALSSMNGSPVMVQVVRVVGAPTPLLKVTDGPYGSSMK